MRAGAPQQVWKLVVQELTKIRYKPGWHFFVEMIRNEPNLTISTTTQDSYHPEVDDYHTAHHFVVPNDVVMNEKELNRWVFDCILLVELHEAMEFFQVDGMRPYAPIHSRAAGTYYDLPED